LTVWDARQAAGALLFAGLAFVLAWLVTAATDEGSIRWSVRAARTLPLAPACAAAGTWLGQARAWGRGEGRALATLGRGPLASSAGAVLGGALVAWIAAASMAFGSGVDVSGFFPVARAPDVYVAAGGGVFVDAVSGYRIEADGSLVAPPAIGNAPRDSLPPLLPPRARGAAAVSTALAGLAFSLLVARARRGSWLTKGLVLGAMVAASIILFHAAAARLVGAMTAVLPAFALVCVALAGFRVARRRWRRAIFYFVQVEPLDSVPATPTETSPFESIPV
jgi:hypothetical protein